MLLLARVCSYFSPFLALRVHSSQAKQLVDFLQILFSIKVEAIHMVPIQLQA